MIEARQTDKPKNLGDPLPALGLGRAPHLEAEGDVLGDRHVRKERVVLEHDADVALFRRLVGDPPPRKRDLAVIGGGEARDDLEQRRLARSGRPEKRVKLALRHVQRDVLQHFRGAEILPHRCDAKAVRRLAQGVAPPGRPAIRSPSRLRTTIKRQVTRTMIVASALRSGR